MTTYSNPGHIADVVGTTGRVEATWANAVRDRLVSHFASTADRDTAFPTPSVGCTAIVDGSPPVMFIYDGTQWTIFDLGTRTYTPTLTQGATTLTKTVTGARYRRTWPVCDVWLYLSITSTGVAASQIAATLPVAAVGLNDTDIVGSGWYNDANGTDYPGLSIWRSSAVVALRTTAGGSFGVSPNITAGSGDIFQARFSYPIG